MNMKLLNTFTILGLVIFSTLGCSKKGATPTNFALTLGAAVSDIGMNGGIILTGTNGTDKFSAGLTPDQANNFSLELPDGDWNFHAVAWMNDGNGMMTGESRCGNASATIEGTDTSVPLTLSSAQCSDGTIAPESSLDSAHGLNTPHFKKVSFTSCLTLAGVAAGNLCAGLSNQDLPGFSTSLRVSFRGKSNFGASLPNLNSKCYNHSGYPAEIFENGYIPSQIRLPYDGTLALGWDLIGFENKNCQERGAIYKMPDGLTGNIGVARIFDFLGSEVQVNFADNYLGDANSVFATLPPEDIVPKVACAPNCYPDSTYAPFDKATEEKEIIKTEVWQALGNSAGIDIDEIQGVTAATVSATDDIQFTTFAEDGSNGNLTEVMFSDVDLGGVEMVSVYCPARNISIEYDSTNFPSISLADIANEVNNQCGDKVMASTGSPNNTPTETFSNYNLSGGTDVKNITRRHTGDLQKVKRLLLGPIGAGLYKNGIVDRASLCDTASYGSYDFIIDGQQVTMELGAPSPSALHPDFAPNSAAQFEKRIRIAFDGEIEEAFYFNCSLDPQVGAYLSRDQKSDGNYRTKQMFWDATTAGEEWVEVASKEEAPAGGLVRQNYFLFKANATTDFDAYSLKADIRGSRFGHVVGQAGAGTLYVLGGQTNQTDIDETFVRTNVNRRYELTTDNFNGSITAYTVEPDALNGAMTAPNMFTGYDMSSFTSGTDNFWDFSF